MEYSDETITTLARETFRIPYLRPFQRLAINRILEQTDSGDGKDKNLLIVLPTGSGKSVCFQLPALLLQGITVIVYPLLSLMNDQRRSLQRNGIASVTLKGGQTGDQRLRLWRKLEDGTARIVITNPETLISERVLGRLSAFAIDLFVVDEAHTVCEWGESFRPAYQRLAQAAERLRPRQMTAFTATASNEILLKLDRMLFQGKKPHRIVASPDRPNIRYHVRRSLCPEHDIIMLLSHGAARPAIVFCRTRKKCEDLAWLVGEHCRNIPVQYYHAGLTKQEREAIEAWFFASSDGVLCATTAYGMGVSKNDVRSVIHQEPSDTAQAYLQESGRAGRDGAPADAWMLLPNGSGRRNGESPLHKAFLGDVCIRESLLRLMDVEPDEDFYCDGCDVCDAAVIPTAEGHRELTGVIRRFPLRFRTEELAWLLSGTRIQPLVRRQDRLAPEYGILGNWTQGHLCNAVEALCENGDIRKVVHGPFSERLYVPFPVRRTRCSNPPVSGASADRSGLRRFLRQVFASTGGKLRNTPATD